MVILQINQLSKQYGSLRAVDNLHLTIEQGHVYGLLGPNGSGKSTTLGMVLGAIKPTSGTFEWFGGKYGNDAARLRIGALLETPNFYPYMNAVQNLKVIAHIKGVKGNNFDELLRLVNLEHRKRDAFKAYSLGMKQRLAVASVLLGDPEVVIFDEPTNGLDPVGIHEMREILLKVASMGKTVFMASHILDEVEKVCSHVAIMKNGKLLATGSVGAILGEQVTVALYSADLQELHTSLGESQLVTSLTREADCVVVTLGDDTTSEDLNKYLFAHGIVLSQLRIRKRTLEQEFIEITRNEGVQTSANR